MVEKNLALTLHTYTDVYHLVFNPPKSEEVASRLTEEAGGVEENMVAGLALYHRHSEALLSCYSIIAKTFNADQPIADLSAQGDRIGKKRLFLLLHCLSPSFPLPPAVHSFLCTQQRSAAPHTPRVVFLGPTGSGKSLQASQLARKYHLVNGEQQKQYWTVRNAIVDRLTIVDRV